MPNWCSNVLMLAHKDSNEIARAIAAFKKDSLLNELIPVPDGLDPDMEYAWKIDHWGAKWDVGSAADDCVDISSPNTVTLTFHSAWIPPLLAYRRMEELGFDVEAYYYEPGIQFAGIWENGSDDYYEGWGDSDGAAKMLPSALDEMFDITNNQAMWEEE